MTAKQAKVWTYVQPSVDASELFKLRDRLGKMLQTKGKAAPKGMEGVMMYRLAVDCDHLARLMDERTGTKRMTFDVFVKEKPKTRKRSVSRKGAAR